MDLSTLQTYVNDRRRDTTESFISNDEITRYLNEALRRIQGENDWEWSRTSASFTYTDGSYKYKTSAIASDFKAPTDLFYQQNYQFEYVSPEDFRALSASSYDIYSLEGSDLMVKTSFGTGTLNLFYYSNYTAKTSGGTWQTQLSASTDEPLMYERYQDLISDFTVSRAYQKEGMLDDWNVATSEYRKSIVDMKREFPSRRAKPKYRMRNIKEFRQAVFDSREDPLRQT